VAVGVDPDHFLALPPLGAQGGCCAVVAHTSVVRPIWTTIMTLMVPTQAIRPRPTGTDATAATTTAQLMSLSLAS
jgi:hypothetical protein